MSKVAAFTVAIAFVMRVAPVVAQDASPLATANGCHRYTLVSGNAQLTPEGIATGVLILERQHDQRRFTLDLETWPAGITLVNIADATGGIDPLSFVNWRFRENGVKGTDRGFAVVASADLETPTKLSFYLVTETLRGNRYTTGGLINVGVVDVTTGVIEQQVFNMMLCRDLSPTR